MKRTLETVSLLALQLQQVVHAETRRATRRSGARTSWPKPWKVATCNARCTSRGLFIQTDRVYAGTLYSRAAMILSLQQQSLDNSYLYSRAFPSSSSLCIMTAYSVEVQKQRYSQELAEHTLRQWEAARAAMERAAQEDARSTSTSPSNRSNSTTKTSSRTTKSRSRGESSASSAPSSDALADKDA